MLTPNTAQRLIPFKTSQNNDLSAAFTTKNESFWTENKVNGYYIIGYIINDKLDPLNKEIIPKVRLFYNLTVTSLRRTRISNPLNDDFRLFK